MAILSTFFKNPLIYGLILPLWFDFSEIYTWFWLAKTSLKSVKWKQELDKNNILEMHSKFKIPVSTIS